MNFRECGHPSFFTSLAVEGNQWKASSGNNEVSFTCTPESWQSEDETANLAAPTVYKMLSGLDSMTALLFPNHGTILGVHTEILVGVDTEVSSLVCLQENPWPTGPISSLPPSSKGYGCGYDPSSPSSACQLLSVRASVSDARCCLTFLVLEEGGEEEEVVCEVSEADAKDKEFIVSQKGNVFFLSVKLPEFLACCLVQA
mmetsp:Transcript_35067/g.88243  ORF Transcript_35067/g.88243 Transcript_35067/m.88243 type:complete len:200 (-) Transcript_35067:144-743(-)|eukprot:CAMPEP_0177659908 /NCGR_PEP_ID=MMETSP0447-20121125/17709_1 /TAXON_ID=0 /ORGANISM="Stygamoeba regulata, Strain BSH-02190019" /LENGTH=199 /DNA_ID=CAMNT_0019164841 /DNA_START=326 /DNA_END=925 /DNA_ORIENTATION=-